MKRKRFYMTVFQWNKIKFFLLFLSLFSIWSFICPAICKAYDLAVVPYKVEKVNINDYKKVSALYTKDMAMAAMILKGAQVYDPLRLKKDLKEFGINPARNISGENLRLLGKTRFLNYIITGKVTKTRNGYRAQSLLYSTAHGRVLSRSDVQARDLLKLAETDVKELLSIFYPVKNIKSKKKYADLTIIYDQSYNMYRDLPALKKSLKSLVSDFYNRWPGSRVKLIGYSDDKLTTGRGSIKHLARAEKRIDSIRLKGANSGVNFYKALSRSMKFPANRKPDEVFKVVVHFTNSPYYNKNFTHSLGLKARDLKMPIYNIISGRVDERSLIEYNSLSTISGGKTITATYHQKIIDSEGSSFHLFVERRRLFSSGYSSDKWRQGLLRYKGTSLTRDVEIGSFVTELYFKNNSYDISPDNMERIYRYYGDRRIIKSYDVDSNHNDIVKKVPHDILKKQGGNIVTAPLARVLIKGGKNSIWIDVNSKKELNYFKEILSLKRMVFLGVQVIRSDEEVYGMAFNPSSYMIDLQSHFIPDNMVLSLNQLITMPMKYMVTGVGEPSTWFIRIKVLDIREKRETLDIRDLK